MGTTSNEQPDHNPRLPRRFIAGLIRVPGRAAVKLMRSIGRSRAAASQQTRAIGKDRAGRLRKLRDRSVAAMRQSITTTRGLPAQAARQLKRPPGAVAT